MAIQLKPEWASKAAIKYARVTAIGTRNLREGPGLSYSVIGKIAAGDTVSRTNYMTWEHPSGWKPGVPDRLWFLVMDLPDKVLGWVCASESVTKTGKEADLIDKSFLIGSHGGLNPKDYLSWVKDLDESTKKFNAVIAAKKASGAPPAADREPLPDAGDVPSSAPAVLGLAALGLLAWKLWPR